MQNFLAYKGLKQKFKNSRLAWLEDILPWLTLAKKKRLDPLLAAIGNSQCFSTIWRRIRMI